MKNLIIKILSLLLLSVPLAQAQDLPLFLAKENKGQVEIVKVIIQLGDERVFDEPEIITLILPVSEGKSASLVAIKDRNGKMTVKNPDNKALKIIMTDENGNEKEYPSVSMANLKEFICRVNIIGGNGYKKAYKIDRYKTVIEDDGPVIDLFAGMIPMNNGDFSITLETQKVPKEQWLQGKVPFYKIDNWIVVDATLPNGKTGRFILDTGAGGQLVLLERMLPEKIAIQAITSVSYSSKGTSEEKGKMIGATGEVSDDNFRGISYLPELVLGNMVLSEVKTNVLKELPEFITKHGVIGIIGLDIMMQAQSMTISGMDQNSGIVYFGAPGPIDKPIKHKQDFKLAWNHIFIDGHIKNHAVSFMLDIGARRSLVSESLLKISGIEYKELDRSKTAGISGTKAESILVEVPLIDMGGKNWSFVPLLMSRELYVTRSMGLEDNSIILGMNFLSCFNEMQLNFQTKQMILY